MYVYVYIYWTRSFQLHTDQNLHTPCNQRNWILDTVTPPPDPTPNKDDITEDKTAK